ncbi:DUF1971 domain-containing protein [Kineosporia sp. A_224]|uniref:DUF1971 domain-containing protein n=1 Tax=Kineosporia sp. A_224 TaxID=1962180 RepID=UPI000B4B0AC4|nr:DUF1971 domain-containing protein [Kineosporia sp. A_224]
MDRPTALPDGAEHVRTTPDFDARTVPAGLLRAHRVADGVWGRLVVRAGTVVFRFEDEPDTPVTVTAGGHVVIPPGRLHHVEPDDGAGFAVEFYRVTDRSTTRPPTGIAIPTDRGAVARKP